MLCSRSAWALNHTLRKPHRALSKPQGNCRGDARFASWLFEILARRKIAREHRLFNELLGIIGPKLAHLRVGFDDRVGEFAIYTRHFADVDVEDRRSVFVESYRADRAVAKPDLVHGFEKRRCVIGLSAGCL